MQSRVNSIVYDLVLTKDCTHLFESIKKQANFKVHPQGGLHVLNGMAHNQDIYQFANTPFELTILPLLFQFPSQILN